MTTSIPLRRNFDAIGLRKLARRSRDPDQTRRLLALALIAVEINKYWYRSNSSPFRDHGAQNSMTAPPSTSMTLISSEDRSPSGKRPNQSPPGTIGKDPLERVSGSLAFGALPRLVMIAAKSNAESDNEAERVLIRVKSNSTTVDWIRNGSFKQACKAVDCFEQGPIAAKLIGRGWEYAICWCAWISAPYWP
jgi:hypothetical protein